MSTVWEAEVCVDGLRVDDQLGECRHFCKRDGERLLSERVTIPVQLLLLRTRRCVEVLAGVGSRVVVTVRGGLFTDWCLLWLVGGWWGDVGWRVHRFLIDYFSSLLIFKCSFFSMDSSMFRSIFNQFCHFSKWWGYPFFANEWLFSF